MYTRLEICTTLESGNHITAKEMIPYIGLIGNNQHKVLPDRPSFKSSYPLPRDLIVRSLARMKREILPVLMEVLESGDVDKIQEVLDAIGFLIFYDRQAATQEYMKKVLKTIEMYKDDDVVVWKGILCLSAFPYTQSIEYLKNVSVMAEKDLFREEAKRALKVMR